MSKAKKLDLRLKNKVNETHIATKAKSIILNNSLDNIHLNEKITPQVEENVSIKPSEDQSGLKFARTKILSLAGNTRNKIRKPISFLQLFKRKNSNKVKSNDFKKTDLEEIAQKEEVKRKRRRKIKIFLSIFFRILLGFSLTISIVVLILVYYIVVPAQRMYNSYTDLKKNGISLLTDIQSKDLTKIDNYIKNIQGDLTSISNEINRYEFLSKLDFTKGYYANFQKSRGILKKIGDLSNTSLPKLKDLLEGSGFKNTNSLNASISNSNQSADSNIKDDKALSLILKQFPRYLSLYDEIKPQLLDIFGDIKNLDLNYVPNIGNNKINDNLIKFNKFTDEFPSISDKAETFLRNLPPLIGVNGDAKYLLVLQTEAEMRSSGGILSEFGYASMHNGEFVGDISLTDMWKLNDYLVAQGNYPNHNNIYGQLHLMQANCGGTWARPQDSPQYPDLYNALDVFKDYYDAANKTNRANFPDYNYIMIINNSFATNLLKIVQPIKLTDGTEVTADNFFDLIKGESDNVNKYRGANTSDRKAIIKEVANAVKKKFLTLPINDIPKVINTTISSFQAKDISLYTKDKTMQAFFDDYGFTARSVKKYSGDYFQLNEAQNCSLKLNRWVRDNVDSDIFIQPSGNINTNVHIHWIQPQIYNPTLIHQYEPTYNHSYRAWVRLFTPDGSAGFKSDGYKQSGYLYYNPITYYDSVMDKETSDNIIQFDHRRFTNKDPIDKKDLNISYNLPKSINYKNDGKYTLILQKHPAKSWGEIYHFNIHEGNQTYSSDIVLDRDKILTYKDGVISVDNYDKKLDWIPELVSQVDWNNLGKK